MMPYYCEECGEAENFTTTQDVTSYGTQEVYIDKEGEVVDYGEIDYHDGESGEFGDDVYCGNCGENVINYSEEEYENIVANTERRLMLENKKPVRNWKKVIKGD